MKMLMSPELFQFVTDGNIGGWCAVVMTDLEG